MRPSLGAASGAGVSSASERFTRSTKYSGSETADGFPFLFNSAVKMSGELPAAPAKGFSPESFACSVGLSPSMSAPSGVYSAWMYVPSASDLVNE